MSFSGKHKQYMSQFLKFGLIGVLNTVISYVVYLILIKLGIHYIVSNLISFSVSVVNSFCWNQKYVFTGNRNRIWWKTFAKTYISYAGTGIVLSSLLLFLWIDIFGITKEIAPMMSLVLTVPINFIVNKFWAYRE